MTALNISIRKKQFAGNPLATFENFEFQLRTGEIASLIGPSGIGKSTLLNILAGLDRDFVGNVDIAPDKTVGIVFQTPRLMPWLSVEENIALVCKVKDTTRIQSMIEQVGLAGHEKKFPAQLSGGMQRRVSLARAFINRPALLLLDEPFVSLDEPSANRLRTLLLDLWEQDTPSVLYVTHDLREAITMADRLIFLGGQPAQQIAERPIELSRPRALQDKNVGRILESVLQQSPDILSGKL